MVGSQTVGGECPVEPITMDCIENLRKIEDKFDFKSVILGLVLVLWLCLQFVQIFYDLSVINRIRVR